MTPPEADGNANRARWESFWAAKQSPGHAHDDEDHYRFYGAELRLLLGEVPARRVLELGCGNGALYPHLGFDRAEEYVGVDFSPAMLEGFRTRYPDAELVCGAGELYQSDRSFDLIFSAEVAQYWKVDQLDQHLDAAAAMLAPEGRIVIASVPWSRMRWAYARGDLVYGTRRSVPVTFLAWANELVRHRIGEWYDYPAINRAAARHDFSVQFYGSVNYPYRMHAVLRR